MARNFAIQLLRGPVANIPILASGEAYWATDTNQLFVGPTPTLINTGGGSTFKMVEIDFGPLPVSEKAFTIIDAQVTATSKLIGEIAYVAPTGKDLDEVEMDTIDLKFGPGSGQFTLYAIGKDGYIADKFMVVYTIG